jgi:hypothetical protein
VLHPIDDLAVLRFRNGNVRHRGGRRRSVPVLFAGREPHHVTGPDFFDGTAFALRASEAGGDDQCLAKRMGMPCGARARLESDARAARARRSRRREQRIDADGAGEPVRRPLAGGLRPVALMSMMAFLALATILSVISASKSRHRALHLRDRAVSTRLDQKSVEVDLDWRSLGNWPKSARIVSSGKIKAATQHRAREEP